MRKSTRLMMMQNGTRNHHNDRQYDRDYNRDYDRDYDRSGREGYDHSHDRRERGYDYPEDDRYRGGYNYHAQFAGMVNGGKEPDKHFDAKKWVTEMTNEDGSRGAHWDMQQTESVRSSRGMNEVDPEAFYVTMNMMYSDYQNVMKKFGVDRPEIYAEMAKAFLCDKDSKQGMEKLKAYYCHVVK